MFCIQGAEGRRKGNNGMVCNNASRLITLGNSPAAAVYLPIRRFQLSLKFASSTGESGNRKTRFDDSPPVWTLLRWQAIRQFADITLGRWTCRSTSLEQRSVEFAIGREHESVIFSRYIKIRSLNSQISSKIVLSNSKIVISRNLFESLCS